MHRMMIPTLAAFLLVFPATAAAQEPAAPTFALDLEPRVLHARPGGEVAFRLVADALADQTLRLSSTAGRLGAAELRVTAEAPAFTTLKVSVPEDAPRRLIVSVRAVGADGEAREAQGVIETMRPRHAPAMHARILVTPGDGAGAFDVRIEPRANRTYHLAVEGAPAGWRAGVEPATLTAGPAASGRATVRLAADDANASLAGARVTLVVTSGEERREVPLHAAAGAHRPWPMPHDERPTPHRPMPSPWAHERVDAEHRPILEQLLQRILRIEAALRARGAHASAEAEA